MQHDLALLLAKENVVTEEHVECLIVDALSRSTMQVLLVKQVYE